MELPGRLASMLSGADGLTRQKAARLVSYSRNVAHEHYKSDSNFGIEIGNDMYEYLKEKQYI